MKYKAPFGSSDPNAAYIDRNTANAVRGSVPPAAAIEWPQREIVDVIAAAGLTPADSLQLTPAIRALIRGFSGLQYLPTGTNFYVNGATGSNANSGLAANTAFQTIQGAIDAIQANYICQGQVILNVASGTYSGFSVFSSLVSSWKIVGAGVGTSVISAPSAAVNAGRGITVYRDAVLDISGFTIQSTAENLLVQGGYLAVRASALTSNQTTSCAAAYDGTLYLTGSIQYSGNGSPGGVILSSSGAAVTLGNAADPLSFTLVGAPVLSAPFARAGSNGNIVAISSAITWSGSATGQRYSADLNGSINVQGAGVNFFPGSTAGTLSSGGQYQ